MDAGRVGGGTPRRRACRTWRSPRVDNTEASPPRPPSRSRRLASFVLGRSPGTHMGWDGHAKQWRRGDAMDAYVYSRGVCASMVILVSASVHPSNADAKAGVVGRVHSAAGSVPPAVPMACLIGRVRWSMHPSSSSILFHPSTAKFSGAMPMPLPVATAAAPFSFHAPAPNPNPGHAAREWSQVRLLARLLPTTQPNPYS